MQIGLGSNASTLGGMLDEALAAEAADLAAFSVSNIFGHDAIGVQTVVGARTSRVELLTAVVPCLPRHPVALAQQALTAQVAAKGRFTLGIGTSHAVVIRDILGLPFDQLADRMREYLAVLLPLLSQEKCEVAGRFLEVRARVSTPDAMPTRCVLAALGPRMLEVAGELTDGTVLWLTGAKAVAESILPPLQAAAKAAGRPAPRVICALPIALASDPDGARERANEMWGRYRSLPSYRRVLDAEGAASTGEVALVGDESHLDRALRRLDSSGVTTFLGTPFDGEEGAVGRTLEYLGDRARTG